MNRKSCAGALMALVLSGAAQAAVIHTSHTVTGIPPGAVGDPFNPVHAPGGPSSSDLINGLLPIASGPGDFQLEGSEGLVALTNGSIGTFVGAGTGADNHAGYATTGAGSGGQSVTYALSGPHHLTRIVTFGGWADTGRDQQNYTIWISDDGVNFDLLASPPSVNSAIPQPGSGGKHAISHRIETFDDAAPYLATGVTHIRFDFLGVENGFTGTTELDVHGVAVPEPATLSLLGAIVGIGLLVRRKAK
jgi:hypothetical protein